MKCPDGFPQKTSPPSCIYSSLPSPFFNCFSCVINGNSWITNFSSDAFSPPNIGVCLPPEGVAKFSLACPMCGIGFESSIYQKLWQCPASQLASCAACTYSNFVWCSSESRCANAIGSCTDRKSGITSFARCVSPSSVSSLPTCSSCLQQNGPLQPSAQVSQWCPKRVCCGSNITGSTSIYSSSFVIKGICLIDRMHVFFSFFMTQATSFSIAAPIPLSLVSLAVLVHVLEAFLSYLGATPTATTAPALLLEPQCLIIQTS